MAAERTVVPTGTGPHRRALTLAEATRGALPEPYTDAEWRALHAASAGYDAPLWRASVLTGPLSAYLLAGRP